MPVTTHTVFDGEIVAENRNGSLTDYVPDPLGSTVTLLDNSQTQTDTFNYWPYGEVQSRNGTTATPFQFVGVRGYWTDSTRRVYVRERHYLPAYARWLVVDPLALHHQQAFQYLLVPYAYAKNSPSTFGDPTGLQLPGYIYCGPQFKPGIGKPRDDVDECCRQHDA